MRYRYGLFLDDFNQFHFEQQGGEGVDVAHLAVTVCEFVRNGELVFGTNTHQLQAFRPTTDYSAYREFGRRATVNRAVEYRAVNQRAMIVYLYAIAGSRFGAFAFLNNLVLQSAFGHLPAFLLLVVLEVGNASQFVFAILGFHLGLTILFALVAHDRLGFYAVHNQAVALNRGKERGEEQVFVETGGRIAGEDGLGHVLHVLVADLIAYLFADFVRFLFVRQAVFRTGFDAGDNLLHVGRVDFHAVLQIRNHTGRGTVVTGRVERGRLNLNDEVEIVGIRPTKKTVVTGIEMFRKSLDYAEAGDNAGVLLRGINREDVERGQILCKPGSVTPHKKFKASVYVLSKEEGGRHTPFFSNYRPQFYFRTTDVTGVITLPEGTEMVMPGDNVDMTVELITPIAIENGTNFSIREGGRTVGAGVVSEILE